MMLPAFRQAIQQAVFVGLICLFLLSGLPAHHAAAGTVKVQSDEAVLTFPKIVTFKIQASSDSPINKLTLHYGIKTNECLDLQFRQDVTLTPDSTIRVNWDWQIDRVSYMMSGMEIWWDWEIQDGAGASFRTERKSLVLTDSSFQWKRIERGNISLYWSKGDESFGKRLMDIATRSLERLSQEAGLAPPEGIHIVIYPSDKEMQEAMKSVAEWAGGAAFPTYSLVMIGIDPADHYVWAETAIPHEIAHLITDLRVGNCRYRDIPLWLSEGLAQFAEGDLPEEDRNLVLESLANGTLPKLTALNERFPADADAAQLAYAQSRVMVTYMIETSGRDRLEKLLDEIGKGTQTNLALRKLYGYSAAELDQSWRASLGFAEPPVQDFSTPTSFPTRTPMPTFELHSSSWDPNASPTPEPTRTITNTPFSTSTPAAQSAVNTQSPDDTATPAPTTPQTSAPTRVAPVHVARGLPIFVLVCLGGGLGAALAGLGVLIAVYMVFFHKRAR